MDNGQSPDGLRRDPGPPIQARRLKLGAIIGAYAVVVIAGLVVIGYRGWAAREIDGVTRGSWPITRPTLSYLAAGDLPVGHRVGEQDLVAPAVPPNLAAALPEADGFVGRYVVERISAGAPVTAASLSAAPIADAVPPGLRRVRIPLDSTVVGWINAGSEVWLMRSDTLITAARVEHLLCQADRCDARLLIDSAAVGTYLQPGTGIPTLSVVLPIIEGTP